MLILLLLLGWALILAPGLAVLIGRMIRYADQQAEEAACFEMSTQDLYLVDRS